MRSVSENIIPLDASVLQHIDSCLGCRACETACPSGVEYGDILEHFRADIESEGIRGGGQKLARRQLLATLTNPVRLAASLKIAGALRKLTGRDGKLPPFASAMITGDPNAEVTLPALPASVRVGKLPETSPPIGEKRFRVGVLAGCVMRVLYHDTNLATVRVLQRAGCEVFAPRSAGCCGALHLHSGYLADAKDRARALIDAIEPFRLDAFIVNSAGCGSTVKEYGALLLDDPVCSQRAAAFSAKVKDICEFLFEIDAAPPPGRFDKTVAYHDACHLAHGQKIVSQPRELLRAVRGLNLVEIPESDTCCGSAGIYNLTQPEMARKLLNRKVEFIANSGAEVVATGNPGCLAWIQQGLKERGISIDVMHPVEILDAAFRSK